MYVRTRLYDVKFIIRIYITFKISNEINNYTEIIFAFTNVRKIVYKHRNIALIDL